MSKVQRQEKQPREITPQCRITNYFFRLRSWDWKDPKYKPIYSRWVSVTKRDLLPMAEGDPFKVKEKIDEVKKWAEANNLTWNLSTVVKRWLEDNTVEKKPYTKDGDELRKQGNAWKAVIWDGSWINYNGSEKDIVWK